NHPRRHYGWTTTKEYRERFGYLDYMDRSECEGYLRDAGAPVQLPPELEERCGFTLYPYVSRTFIFAVTWHRHAQALEQLRHGAPHPAREQLLELSGLARETGAVLKSLTPAELDLALAVEEGDTPLPAEEVPAKIKKYLDLERRLKQVFRM